MIVAPSATNRQSQKSLPRYIRDIIENQLPLLVQIAPVIFIGPVTQKTSGDAARAQQEMSIKMDQARAEGQEMINQAREVADRFREEELARARQEIASERERAEADIKRERNAAIEELRSEFTVHTL